MYEDGWIPTVCYQCKAECSILAHVKNGIVQEVKEIREHAAKCVSRAWQVLPPSIQKNGLPIP